MGIGDCNNNINNKMSPNSNKPKNNIEQVKNIEINNNETDSIGIL